MMSRQQVREQRLKEITAMVGTLTERMMTAYVLGTRPSEAEVKAFCQGVLLLEDYAVPLPLFAEDVIGQLALQEARDDAPAAQARPAARQTESLFDRVLHKLQSLLAYYELAAPPAISAKA